MNSRFLDEIPRNFLNYIKNPNSDSLITSFEDVKNPPQKMVSSSSDSKYAIGQIVSHAKFGIGTILNYEGSGDSMRLQIKFQKVGTKWLISSYANIPSFLQPFRFPRWSFSSKSPSKPLAT